MMYRATFITAASDEYQMYFYDNIGQAAAIGSWNIYIQQVLSSHKGGYTGLTVVDIKYDHV